MFSFHFPFTLVYYIPPSFSLYPGILPSSFLFPLPRYTSFPLPFPFTPVYFLFPSFPLYPGKLPSPFVSLSSMYITFLFLSLSFNSPLFSPPTLFLSALGIGTVHKIVPLCLSIINWFWIHSTLVKYCVGGSRINMGRTMWRRGEGRGYAYGHTAQNYAWKLI